MDEIIPGLWIGDLQCTKNVENLKAHGIFSILTAMRGRITIHETFIRHQIQLDDTEDADVMTHFLPSIHFIQAELDKGRGVLVHCQAGVSRSSTIVAAYLMYLKDIDPRTALELIKQARPAVEPNQNFLQQLELFHAARYKISRREKAIRMYYMGRAVEEVMNGDGSPPQTEMFAKYPRTPSDSLPNTPGGPRRRIRCKMCRQELATREHMLDHGQLGPATPAPTTPAVSRRPSTAGQSSRSQNSPLAGEVIRRAPRKSFNSGLGESLSMSAIQEDPGKGISSPILDIPSPSTSQVPTPTNTPAIPYGHPLHSFRSMSQTLVDQSSMSALEIEDDGDTDSDSKAMPQMNIDLTGTTAEDISIHASQLLGRRLSDALISFTGDTNPPAEDRTGSYFRAHGSEVTEHSSDAPKAHVETPTTHLISPTDLAAQLMSDPKLVALRSPVSVTPPSALASKAAPISAPILVNPKCSGYFVEPMKWMEHFLSSGEIAGKIICPNKKCNTKLGNFDWAGVCCGCKEWVTPGFCISRSKVDEVL